jgi:prepilin-type N-terminal cleavage/methylation domain-containing protein
MSCTAILSRSHRQKGFTLIEVLVALVVTGMLASLLMSAIFFAGRTRLSVEQYVGAQLQQQASYSRFEQTLKYCLPELQREPIVFRGSSSMIECFSTQNLQGQIQLAPLNIRWVLQEPVDGQSQLIYTDQINWDKPIPIATLPSKVRFVFWDANGRRRSDWQFDPGQIRLIPTRITIEFDERPELNGLWSAALRATPHPDLPPPTIFGTTIQ